MLSNENCSPTQTIHTSVKTPFAYKVQRMYHSGSGLMLNTALGFTSYCICHLTPPLMLYFPCNSYNNTLMYILLYSDRFNQTGSSLVGRADSIVLISVALLLVSGEYWHLHIFYHSCIATPLTIQNLSSNKCMSIHEHYMLLSHGMIILRLIMDSNSRTPERFFWNSTWVTMINWILPQLCA